MTLFVLLACSGSMESARIPDSGVRYDVDGDGYYQSDDCDDNDPAVHPGAVEICDGKDNDCDGHYDQDAKDATLVYPDADGDGFAADGAKGTLACKKTKGMTTALGDCDDTNPKVNPDAKEQCGDGIDNDCVGGDAPC